MNRRLLLYLQFSHKGLIVSSVGNTSKVGFASKVSKSDDVSIHNVQHYNVEKTPITAHLWDQRLKSTDDNLTSIESTNIPIPNFILDKSSKESRLVIKYNFSQDQKLRDLYVDSHGSILTGKLLEDLDALAGNVAFQHCDDNNPQTRPLSLVTASVERIRQSKKISAFDDILLIGQVAWVGTSSMDVLMEIHRIKDIPPSSSISNHNHASNSTSNHTSNATSSESSGNIELEPVLIRENVSSRLLSSLFTYVARDRRTGVACPVNKFKPTGDDESRLFNKREELAMVRKVEKKRQKSTTLPLSLPVSTSTLTNLVERGQAMVSIVDDVIVILL